MTSAAMSRRRALGWLGVGAMGGLLSGCGGGGSSGTASTATAVTIPTTTATPTPAATAATIAAVDETTLRLHELAARRGLLFGAPYLKAEHMTKPGPGGVGTLGDFFREQCSFYCNVMILSGTIEWQPGIYNTTELRTFLATAAAHGKPWRGHCLLYPKADTTLLQAAITPSGWRDLMSRHFEAIAAVPGAQAAASLDVVNELIDPTRTDDNGGYQVNAWHTAAGGPDYIVHAFKEARRLWPTVPLYWCHDQTEQLTDSYHINMAALNLKAIEAAMKAGAPIDGYNMQGHLQLRLGLDAARLKGFLDDLTRNLGLKITIGELDVHTGYGIDGVTDAKPPEQYAIDDYDAQAADRIERFLDVALPYVQASGKQLTCWGLSDIDDPWSRSAAERPMPWDKDYKPKPIWSAIQRSLMRLPKA